MRPPVNELSKHIMCGVTSFNLCGYSVERLDLNVLSGEVMFVAEREWTQ